MRIPGVEAREDRLVVAGSWTYWWGHRRHPCVHPLATPAGRVLTVDAPDDHPWHHGLWCTIKFVDGDNFWEEVAPYGVQRHDGPPEVSSPRAGTLQIRGALRWIRPDRTTVAIDEERTLTHVPLDEHSYALDVIVVLVPRSDVVLDRTPFTTWGGYGGLTLRGRPDWVDTTLRTDDGAVHQVLHGDRSRWCSISGTLEGAPVGVAILDHPANLRHPSPWYASTRADTYGDDGWSNFANAALLWDEPLALAAGEALHLAYRLVVHDGERSADQLGADWHAWSS